MARAAMVPPTFNQATYGPPPKKRVPVWVWVLLGVGLCCCCLGVLVIPALLLPVFQQARLSAKKVGTLSNIKQVALASLMYASDYDDQFPYVRDTGSAVALVKPYAANSAFQDPTAGGSFVFNLNVGGVVQTSIDTPYAIPTWLESLPDPSARLAVAFVDGHAKLFGPVDMPSVRKEAEQQFKRPAGAKPLPPNYVPPPKR